jgi:hypothetical protein
MSLLGIKENQIGIRYEDAIRVVAWEVMHPELYVGCTKFTDIADGLNFYQKAAFQAWCFLQAVRLGMNPAGWLPRAVRREVVAGFRDNVELPQSRPIGKRKRKFGS